MSLNYDTNGNMTEMMLGNKQTDYIYNIENRLTTIKTTERTIAEYYYDPFGRRLWKKIDETTSYFIYSDEGLVGECDQTGKIVKSYGYKPGSTWTTDPLFVKKGGNYYFYHNNHLGAPQKITSENGNVVWSTKYASFGHATTEIDIVKNNLRLPGQYFDSESELHYNFFRYYSPKAGRYLNSDPIGLKGGSNLFTYISNNPLNASDPLGLKWVNVGNTQQFLLHELKLAGNDLSGYKLFFQDTHKSECQCIKLLYQMNSGTLLYLPVFQNYQIQVDVPDEKEISLLTRVSLLTSFASLATSLTPAAIISVPLSLVSVTTATGEILSAEELNIQGVQMVEKGDRVFAYDQMQIFGKYDMDYFKENELITAGECAFTGWGVIFQKGGIPIQIHGPAGSY